jgi:hypothetical protein
MKKSESELDELSVKIIERMRDLESQVEKLEDCHDCQQNLRFSDENCKQIRKMKMEISRLNEELYDLHGSTIGGAIKRAVTYWGYVSESGRKLPPPNIPADDFRNEAWFAFGKFVREKYDPKKHKKFTHKVWSVVFKHLKELIGEDGMKTSLPGSLCWGLECLQKLSNIRKQESYKQKRYVSIEEICEKLNITKAHVKSLMSLRYGFYPLIKTNSENEDYLITDLHGHYSPDSPDYESEITKAKFEQIGEIQKKHCTEMERGVNTLIHGRSELYVICIDEIAKNHPAIRKRISEIEDEILEDITDDGLLETLKGFFAQRVKYSWKPFPSLLKRMGIGYLSKN